MSKNFFLSTDVWAETAYAKLLHDEFRVYMYLRHPIECSLTGLDDHKLFTITSYTGIEFERVTQIVTTLCNTNNEYGQPLLYSDNGLFFVPASALDKIRSAPRYTQRIIKTRDKYKNWKSQYGEIVNRSFGAFMDTWIEEIHLYDALPKNGKVPELTPGAMNDNLDYHTD